MKFHIHFKYQQNMKKLNNDSSIWLYNLINGIWQEQDKSSKFLCFQFWLRFVYEVFDSNSLGMICFYFLESKLTKLVMIFVTTVIFLLRSCFLSHIHVHVCELTTRQPWLQQHHTCIFFSRSVLWCWTAKIAHNILQESAYRFQESLCITALQFTEGWPALNIVMGIWILGTCKIICARYHLDKCTWDYMYIFPFLPLFRRLRQGITFEKKKYCKTVYKARN